MKHAPSAARVQALHPAVVSLFTDFINMCEVSTGLTFCVVQGIRTFAEQDALYAKGRTQPGPKVTNAKGGYSWHNWGLALDMCPFKSDGHTLNWDYKFEQIAGYAENMGINWGGKFISIRDLDHFEKTFNLQLAEMLKRKNKKDFLPGTTWIRLT